MEVIYINSYSFSNLITPNTFINIWFDNSGSMNTTLSSLQTMRTTLLTSVLLPFYNNDINKYNSNVRTIIWGSGGTGSPTQFVDLEERTLSVMTSAALTQNNLLTADNVINLIFTDENSPYSESSITSQWTTDLNKLRSDINIKPRGFYRSVVFAVTYSSAIIEPKVNVIFTKAINGTTPYTGSSSLISEQDIVKVIFNTNAGDTSKYYANKVVEGMNLFGANLTPLP